MLKNKKRIYTCSSGLEISSTNSSYFFRKLWQNLFPLLFLSAIPGHSYSKDFDVKGWVGTKIEAEDLKNGEISHRIEVDLDTKRENGIRAEASLRYVSLNEEVLFREALVNKKMGDGYRLEFGYNRKRFGLEFENSKLRRNTIERNPVYKRLTVFTYTGRETMLRYYRKAKYDKDRNGLELALCYSEDQNASLVFHQKFPVSEDDNLSYWLQLQSDHTDTGTQLVGSAIAAYELMFGNHGLDLELITGVDPNQTELNKTLNIGGTAYFAATKIETVIRLWREKDRIWDFISSGSYFAQDLDEPSFNSMQALLGARYQTGPLDVALNVELVGSTSRLDTSNRRYSESNLRFEIIYEY